MEACNLQYSPCLGNAGGRLEHKKEEGNGVRSPSKGPVALASLNNRSEFMFGRFGGRYIPGKGGRKS